MVVLLLVACYAAVVAATAVTSVGRNLEEAYAPNRSLEAAREVTPAATHDRDSVHSSSLTQVFDRQRSRHTSHGCAHRQGIESGCVLPQVLEDTHDACLDQVVSRFEPWPFGCCSRKLCEDAFRGLGWALVPDRLV